MSLNLKDLSVNEGKPKKKYDNSVSVSELSRITAYFLKHPSMRCKFEKVEVSESKFILRIHHGTQDKRTFTDFNEYWLHYGEPVLSGASRKKVVIPFNLPIDSTDPKAHNKAVCEYIGMPIYTFRALWKAFMYACFVEPYEDLIKEYGFISGGKGLNVMRVNKIRKTFQIIRQNRNDKIDNISPLCFAYGKYPQELKEFLGKSKWKKLCKNTKHRNKIIARNFSLEELKISEDGYTLPTTLMACQHFEPTSQGFLWWWKTCGEGKVKIKSLSIKNSPYVDLKVRTSSKDEMLRKVNIFNDTRNMYRRLFGLESNHLSSLSERRINELHEEYTKEIMYRRVKEPYMTFPLLDKGGRNLLYETRLIHGGVVWKAKLLTTPAQMIEEGRSQHHCVASYIPNVEEGCYLVYSITKNGERYSTLGMARDVTNGYRKNQHYKAGNKMLDEREAILLEERIVDWYVEMNFNLDWIKQDL